MKFSTIALSFLSPIPGSSAQVGGKRGGSSGDNLLCASPPLCDPIPEDATEIDDCDFEIDMPGEYFLTSNIECSEANGGTNSKAIEVTGRGPTRIDGEVTIDCRGNEINGNGFVDFGIGLLEADTVEIKNCVIQGFLVDGIGDENNAENVGPTLVIDNVISRMNMRDGMDVKADNIANGATSVTIRNSKFDDNRLDGLVINGQMGAVITIIDSTMNGNGSDGIRSGRQDMAFFLSGVELNNNGEFGSTIDAKNAVTYLDVQACGNDLDRTNPLDIRFSQGVLMRFFGSGVICDNPDTELSCDCSCDEVAMPVGKKGMSMSM